MSTRPRPARGTLHLAGALGATLFAMSLAALVWPGATHAQAPLPEGVRVTTSVEPTEPRVGERVRVVIDVEHPADRLVIMPVGLERRPALELITAELPSTLPEGNRLTTRFAFVVQPFALGPVATGSVVIQVLAEDGSAQEFRQALPPLAVRTTIDAARASLRPLKPQATISGAPPAWVRPTLATAAVIAGLAVLAAALVAVRRRLAESDADAQPLPTLATVEDEARVALDTLRTDDLLAVPDLEAYYGRLSSTVRGYLQQRFDFRATALTRRELERRMAAESLDRWQARLVSGLLERCDAAVYAGVYPPLASADHDLTVAYEIVELARPRRTPEAVPA